MLQFSRSQLPYLDRAIIVCCSIVVFRYRHCQVKALWHADVLYNYHMIAFTVLEHTPFSKSQNLIVLSNEPVIRHFLANENLLAFIVSLCPWNVCSDRMVFKLQTMVLCSVELAATNSLSMDTATSVIGLEKPRSVWSSFPLLAFQILTKASPPPVIIASPRGL